MSILYHRLAAVLFADIAGYSRVPEEVAIRFRRKMLSLARENLAAYEGRLVKSQGDDILAEFSSATQAVMFAVTLQEKIAAQNAAASPDQRFRLRIGIHVGEVVVEGEDILGDAVNTAKRTESLAAPGGICMTESVWRQVHEQLPRSIRRLGRIPTKHLKATQVSYHFDPPGASWAYRLVHRFQLALIHPVRVAGLLVMVGLILWAAFLLASIGVRFLPAGPAKLLSRAQASLERYDKAGNVESAINDLSKIPPTAEEYRDARGYLGLAYLRKYAETGELKTRTDAFNAATNSLALNADMPVAHLVQGLVAEDKGDLITASNELFRASALEREENGVTLIKFARVCRRLLATTKADECIRKAREVQKKNWDFYNEFAKYEFTLGNYDEALSNGLHAVQEAPNNSFAQCNVANFYLVLDNYSNHMESAWAFLEAARKSRPTAVYYHSMGEYYRAGEKLDEAVQNFRKAAELRPEDYRFWGNTGISMRGIGKTKEAKECLLKAISKAESILPDTQDCLVRANLGLYHAALDQPAEAVKLLVQAMRECPDNRQVRDAAISSKQFLGSGPEAEEVKRLLDKF